MTMNVWPELPGYPGVRVHPGLTTGERSKSVSILESGQRRTVTNGTKSMIKPFGGTIGPDGKRRRYVAPLGMTAPVPKDGGTGHGHGVAHSEPVDHTHVHSGSLSHSHVHTHQDGDHSHDAHLSQHSAEDELSVFGRGFWLPRRCGAAVCPDRTALRDSTGRPRCKFHGGVEPPLYVGRSGRLAYAVEAAVEAAIRKADGTG